MDFTKPRYTPMSRRRRIYEGKAKVLYEGPEPGTLIQHFKDDATAFNAKKHEVIEGKGVLNNRISEYVFQHLNDIGVPTHFIRRLNMREQLIREVEIIPLEVVVRNIAAGSLSQRLGIEEGTQLPRSIIEFYYKNDQLNDPMVSEEHITAFGWATPQEIDDIMSLAIRVNDFLSGLFLGVGIRLVDFKMETGRLWENDLMRIVVADEISPDSCRLWDIKSNEKLDKDRFRRDLGGLLEAYTEVAKRLGIMSEGERPRAPDRSWSRAKPTPREITIGLVVPFTRDAVPFEGPIMYPGVCFIPRGVGVRALTPEGYDPAWNAILPAAENLGRRDVDAIMVIGTSLTFFGGRKRMPGCSKNCVSGPACR